MSGVLKNKPDVIAAVIAGRKSLSIYARDIMLLSVLQIVYHSVYS